MKLFLILLVGLTLIGCGKPGDSAAPNSVIPVIVPVVPGCKSINSVWTSTVDFERHDFTLMNHGVTVSDYEYTGSNGLRCGYADNPNHEIQAGLQVPADFGYIGSGWDYRLFLNYSLPIGSTCGSYGSNEADPTQVAMIIYNCDEIQICRGDFYSVNNCKTFR